MNIKSRFVALAFLASAALLPAQNSAREIASKTFPSVVLLVLEDDDHRPVALGSGFLVGTNVIASNRHVVRTATSGYAKLVGKPQKYAIKGIVGVDEVHDLVFLSIEGCAAPPLSLGDSTKVQVGDTVFSVGNPKGLEGTFASGIVSAIRETEGDTLLQISAPISPGSSGGPIVDERGNVVGVAVATYNDGQNLNFAIPVSYVQKLLGKERTLTRLSTSKAKVGERSVVDKLGGRGSEGVESDNLKWEIISRARGDFVLTFRNKLRVPIRNIRALVVFRDDNGKALDFTDVTSAAGQIIPPGLAKPARGKVDDSTFGLYAAQDGKIYLQVSRERFEVRILDFEIVEQVDQ